MTALILTLRMDPASLEWFDAQRRRHFPAERNFLSAHLTLFHALPVELLDDARHRLQTATRRDAFPIEVTGLRSLGRGVAYVIESAELAALRATLARHWWTHLTRQDSQPFAAHVTVQNKVDPATARGLLRTLGESFVPRSVMAVGLELWHYAGGPWEAIDAATFADVAGVDPQRE